MSRRLDYGWWLAALCVLFCAAGARAGDWPQFRGPGGTGVSDETGLPLHWGPSQNVRWKAELPGRGLSSPVVSRGRVYVTACSGPLQERLQVLCFAADSGRRLWQREVRATGNTLCHPKTAMAAPTPVTDGERIYALFASGDLVCLDTDGNVVWYRALAHDYPGLTNQIGMAASPVLWKDVLLLSLETAGESCAAALDKRTGQNRWKVGRPRAITWVTPLIITRDHRDEVLFQSSEDVTAYDPASGRPCWTYPGKGLFPVPSVPSPTCADGLVVLTGGVALRPGADGTTPQVVWKSSKLQPAYASPLFYRGRVYALNNSAILLNCFDGQTGKILWQQRLKGPFSASPVAADGKLYLVNEEGIATVLAAGAQPRVLATNTLPDTFLATPALAEGAIFLRSDRYLYCVAESDRH